MRALRLGPLPSLAIVLAFAVAAPARAGLLEFVGKPAKTIEASGQKIPVFYEARVAAKEGAQKVLLTGAGVRVKKVVLIKANVYVATSYAEDPKAVQAGDPLEGFRKSRTRALQLTFLRDVSASKVRDAFRDSLKENDVDPAKAPIADLLAKLDLDLPEKGKLTFVGVTGAGDDKLVVELPNDKQITVSGKGLVDDFWKIWFGKPADGGLESLKTDLAGKKGDTAS